MSDEIKSPAFQFYPKDFLTDAKVIVMSPEIRGLYITLLCVDWLEDGFLESQMLRLAGYDWLDRDGNLRTDDCHGTAIALLSRCFESHPTKPGHITNPRLAKIRKEQRDRREEKVNAGKNGAKSRWNSKLRPMAEPWQCHTSANGKRIANDSSSSSSSSSSSNIDIYANSHSPSPPPSKKSKNWPPAGDEIAPLVFLTVDQKAELEKVLRPKELDYWIKELSMVAEQRPEWWKKKYRNHKLVIAAWRKRKLEEGFTWNDTRALYEKQSVSKVSDSRPPYQEYKPPPRGEDIPLSEEERQKTRNLVQQLANKKSMG